MYHFNAKINIIGINPYVLLPKPVLDNIFNDCGKTKGPIPVIIQLKGQTFFQTLVKYSGKWRLYINGPMMKHAKVKVGDTINVMIRFNSAPPEVSIHPDLKKAFSKNKKAQSAFKKLTPSKQKEICKYIHSLKTAESVARNIEKVINQLSSIKTILIFLFFICGYVTGYSQPIYEYIDLQIHPTMHVPYPFFGKGLEFFDENDPPQLSYKHQFNNVNYANYFINNPGLRIMVVGTLNNEYVPNAAKAKKMILQQIKYINDFAEKNSDHFVVAKNPQQIREYVLNTKKTIIVHSIEGGKELIKSQEDANFWAEQGISFITLIHLVDGEYGGAAILPGVPTRIINNEAPCDQQKETGLTELGEKAIVWLANAGIMTDITHMNDRTRKDALNVMEKHGIPPLSTHDGFKPLQHHSRALDKEDIIKIYSNGGFISLPISGYSCMPYHPDSAYQKQIDSLNLYCEGSIDNYIFLYNAVKDFLQNQSSLGYYDSLPENEKVNFSIGFQSDFNGWLNHSRPRYGEDGCYHEVPDSIKEPIETLGLAHPGLLNSQWNVMKNEGVDLQPILRASEKFIQQWQYFIDHKGGF